MATTKVTKSDYPKLYFLLKGMEESGRETHFERVDDETFKLESGKKDASDSAFDLARVDANLSTMSDADCLDLGKRRARPDKTKNVYANQFVDAFTEMTDEEKEAADAAAAETSATDGTVQESQELATERVDSKTGTDNDAT